MRGERDKPPAHSYGPFFLLLDPIRGDAMVAKRNGRMGLAIHWWRFRSGWLTPRPEGCLRVSNETATALAGLVEPEIAAGNTVEYECMEVEDG